MSSFTNKDSRHCINVVIAFKTN